MFATWLIQPFAIQAIKVSYCFNVSSIKIANDKHSYPNTMVAKVEVNEINNVNISAEYSVRTANQYWAFGHIETLHNLCEIVLLTRRFHALVKVVILFLNWTHKQTTPFQYWTHAAYYTCHSTNNKWMNDDEDDA